MIVTLHTDTLASLEQIERFLDGTGAVSFHAPDPQERRDWIGRVNRPGIPGDSIS